MIYIQLLIVLASIFIGARVGGIGLGIFGMLGLFVLVFVFSVSPGNPPIDVMLMIVSVITAAATLQAAHGLDYMVNIAERILRRNPSRITLIGPLVCYFFTFLAGTGHIAYSLLPIIGEIATQSKVRPERPLGISVIASQQAITASPISAATAALLSAELLGSKGIELSDILMVCVPSTLIGVIAGALVSNFIGVELEQDPVYLERLKKGMIESGEKTQKVYDFARARWATLIFLIGVFSIVLLGSIVSFRPVFNGTPMNMPYIIEIIMMCTAGLILVLAKVDVDKAVKGSVFSAGMQAVIAIFGIAWMGDTFFNGNLAFFKEGIQSVVTNYPFLFAIALFIMSILLFSQAATVRTLYPLGIALGISPLALIAMFPAVNGYFFIPNYPTVVAAINFDRTGTTRIGKFVINHSFQIPGFVATIVAIGVGYLIIGFMQ